jgi:hypothetical protein
MKCRVKIFLLHFIIFLGGLHATFAQEKVDTTHLKKTPIHSPRLASLMSTVLPGSGQVYNKKYWKLPIVYAGLGGLGYLFYSNRIQYNKLAKEVRKRNDKTINTSEWDSTYSYQYSASDLLVFANGYRRKSELSAVGLLVFYSFQIVDAYVDAHLFSFDVSDDLSFHLSPTFINLNKPGISLTLHFKK